MLDEHEPVYRQPLGNQLMMRTAANERDVERVAEFNASIHPDPGIAGMTCNLFVHHPATRGADLVFVEDETSGQVVSSLCLIPWIVRYEEVELLAGEQGIVGTLEAYRGRGLIRAQVEYFKRRLRQRGCLLSQIQGIPYFYRQFGYEYALPLEGGWRVEKYSVPEPPAGHALRVATLDDLPALMRFYKEAAQDLAICAARDEATWRYLFAHTQETAMECENWLVEDGRQQAVGYMRLPKFHFGDELVVNEVSQLGFNAALAVLRHLKKLAEERAAPAIRLNVPAACSLMRVARSLGARDLGTYAWQIHVPDMAALLRALGPVLERRVAHSPFVGLTRAVPLCFYREIITLHFEAGRLTQVTAAPSTDTGPINLPPLQFIPLLLGYRTIDELRAVFPDVSVAASWRLLVDTLFPKLQSFLYTIY